MRRIVDRFNIKYPNLCLAINKTPMKIGLKIMINETSVKDLFLKFHLPGRPDSNKADIALEIPQEVRNTYSKDTQGFLALRNCSNRHAVEVLFSEVMMLNPLSPEFRILTKHALSNFNPEMEINENDDTFGFELDDVNMGLIYLEWNVPGEITY